MELRHLRWWWNYPIHLWGREVIRSYDGANCQIRCPGMIYETRQPQQVVQREIMVFDDDNTKCTTTCTWLCAWKPWLMIPNNLIYIPNFHIRANSPLSFYSMAKITHGSKPVFMVIFYPRAHRVCSPLTHGNKIEPSKQFLFSLLGVKSVFHLLKHVHSVCRKHSPQCIW